MIPIMIEAGIDKESVQVDKPNEAGDGCRGFCDYLDGYFCLDFFGICEPCSQADCESRDKSFCPPKCEDYLKRQQPTYTSPTRTASKSTTPDFPQGSLSSTASFQHSSSSDSLTMLTDELTQPHLRFTNIFVPVIATGAILILILLCTCMICVYPRAMFFLLSTMRMRQTRRDASPAVTAKMKVRSTFTPASPNPCTSVAMPCLPPDLINSLSTNV
ncbi:uncharacterized protein LOC105441671 [Strongylocentrotus purpuratus]|uniref:Uncharacterized protein n=1 Tax=Strongylocentrotus purpuratus TaxID=7668 RepID=A0A7M7HLP3_STRPU|nr:uncharacterized protein LOC105441671 [Strongylocentrotus purpuratus]|eukprot:XP_011671333.1 PREDICTED: uncharacterized protein LOC105441671 [Strongylocentrotus purpuratus]